MKKPKVTIQDLLRKEGKGQTGYERRPRAIKLMLDESLRFPALDMPKEGITTTIGIGNDTPPAVIVMYARTM